MIKQGGIKDIDVLLHPYLMEESEELARHLLAQLFTEQIDPVVIQIIGYRLASQSSGSMKFGTIEQHLKDLQSEVNVRLLTKLHELKTGEIDHGIKDFRSYAAVIAHNTCNELFRRQNLQHSRLKDHLRYILTNEPEFALWHDETAGWVAGLAGWRDRSPRAQIITSIESPEEYLREKLDLALDRRKTVAQQLALIFNATRRPLVFTQLIKIMAVLRGVEIRQALNNTVATDPSVLAETHAAPAQANLESEIQQRLYLQKLWLEICRLPLPQRAALLLNLIDKDTGDRGLIISLADLRIATMREIAECLSLSPEEFAKIWVDLPWDDSRIALHLGTTRRKVMRLRLAARKLLANRMK